MLNVNLEDRIQEIDKRDVLKTKIMSVIDDSDFLVQQPFYEVLNQICTLFKQCKEEKSVA